VSGGSPPLGPGPEDAGPAPADPAPVASGPPAERDEPRRGGARQRRRYRRRRVLVAALGFVVLVVIAVVAFYEIEAHPFGGVGPQVIVSVSQGEPTDAVVGTLADKGVIGSSLAFRLNFLIHGTPSIEPGAYRFFKNQSFTAVRTVLSGGPDVFAVTVLPGYTLNEVANAVDDIPGHSGNVFDALTKSGAVHSPFEPAGSQNLEGLLGAGTYQVLPGETNTQLLTQMVTHFDQQAAAAGLTTASASALGMTPYEVIAAASIVQKEGYIVKNMGPVARVIYNRVAQGIPLQMDSTVLYSLGQDGGPVTPADEKLHSPYNTYLNKGLTPTPICIPSQAALAAAVSPTPGQWLFFVVVDKVGTEAFADTFAEQMANEQLAQSRGVG